MVKTAKRVSSGLVIDAIIGQNAVGSGVGVKAIVDTGADLSIISETVFSKLEAKPVLNERIRIRCAGENLTFDARKIGPITVKTGSLVLNTCLYVGPIEDDMIIGLDLLQTLEAKVDFKDGTLKLGGEDVPMRVQKQSPVSRRLVFTQNLSSSPTEVKTRRSLGQPQVEESSAVCRDLEEIVVLDNSTGTPGVGEDVVNQSILLVSPSAYESHDIAERRAHPKGPDRCGDPDLLQNKPSVQQRRWLFCKSKILSVWFQVVVMAWILVLICILGIFGFPIRVQGHIVLFWVGGGDTHDDTLPCSFGEVDANSPQIPWDPGGNYGHTRH